MNRLPFDKALRDMLATGSGKPVGLYALPAGASTTNGYYVLYAMPSDYSGPPFGDDHADAEWTVQITCVAAQGDQAMWLQDKARAVILGRDAADPQRYAVPLVVPGMSITMRRAADEGPMDPDDGVVSYPQRYTFTVTPA